MTTQEPTLIARKYRYANGGVYNPRHYVIWDGRRAVGAAYVFKSGKAIAWAGMISDTKLSYIQHDSDFYVWGDDLRAALAAFKPLWLAFDGEQAA